MGLPCLAVGELSDMIGDPWLYVCVALTQARPEVGGQILWHLEDPLRFVT